VRKAQGVLRSRIITPVIDGEGGARTPPHRQLGKILKGRRRISTGWLLDKIEADGQKAGGVGARIRKRRRKLLRGRHRHACGKSWPLHHGPEIDDYAAEFTSFIPGRKLQDDATC